MAEGTGLKEKQFPKTRSQAWRWAVMDLTRPPSLVIRKWDRRQKTSIFRHWTTGGAELRSPRVGKQMR